MHRYVGGTLNTEYLPRFMLSYGRWYAHHQKVLEIVIR